MRTALEDDPHYFWGWQQLASWYRKDENATDQFLEAARMLARIAPNNATSFGYLGEAKVRAGDRAGAKADLRRALDLAPDYDFAGMLLFDEHLEDKELDDAAEVLATMEEHTPGPYVTARAVQLAAKRDDQDKAEERFGEVCRAKSLESDWPVEASLDAMAAAGWRTIALARLRREVDGPDVHPAAAALLVRVLMVEDHRRAEKLIAELWGRGEVSTRAAGAYMDYLNQSHLPSRTFSFVRANTDHLKADTQLWGTTGSLLADFPGKGYRAAIDWLADWPEREGVQPWMLMNLVMPLRALGRVDEAHRVSEHALTLPPDYATPLHAVWLAFDAALAGEREAANKRLAEMDRARCDSLHLFVWALIDALRLVQRAEGGDQRSSFRQAREMLAAAAAEHEPVKDYRPALRRTYRRAVARLARSVGGPAASLWGLWRRAFPRLPAAAQK
jgi:Tfp pilus assembly protein PilF